MQSDIIIHPGPGPEKDRKGRIINMSIGVVAKARAITDIDAEETMLHKIWPDWEERVMEAISLRIGPCNDPSVLYQIPLGRIVETVLIWAGFPHERENIAAACSFLSGHLGLNFNDGMNQPHTINPRTISKATLLFILSEVAKKAKGFTREGLIGKPNPKGLK